MVTLALGVGANTAIFSVINSVMLRPLPVRAPEQLVELLSQFPGEPARPVAFSPRVFDHLRSANHVFSDVTGTSLAHFRVVGDGLEAERVDGA